MKTNKLVAAGLATVCALQPVTGWAASANVSAQKLSLRHAVPAKARIAAAPGKSKAVSTGLIVTLVIVAGAIGVVAATAGDSN